MLHAINHNLSVKDYRASISAGLLAGRIDMPYFNSAIALGECGVNEKTFVELIEDCDTAGRNKSIRARAIVPSRLFYRPAAPR